jgi:hypothetical protein
MVQGRALIAAAMTTAALGVGTTSAGAEPIVTEYPTQPNARTFDTNSGGWAPEIQQDGVCVPSLTCPNVRAQYESADGEGGQGGYLRTSISPPDSLAAALVTSEVIYRSPPFLYNGARGNEPDRLTFRISRRANVEDFLAILNDSAEFTVQIVDVAGGGHNSGVTLVEQQTLAGTPEWAQVQPVQLDTDDLKKKHRYRIEIITTYVTDAILFPDATSDYDNVKLRAVFNPDSRRHRIRIPELRRLLRQGPPKTAVYRNGKLRVRVPCPKKATDPCVVAATGMVKKGGRPITDTRRKRIKPGAAKTVRLKVRKPEKLVGQKKATIRLRVATGGSRVTVFKRVTIRGNG